MVEAVRYRLDLLLAEQKRLELASPQKAIVYRAPIRQEKSEQDELPNWSGSLLDRENQSAWVRAGDPVCQLGSPDHMNAIAVMAQDDLESVRVGEQVDVLLISSGETVAGEIARISGLELDERDESTIGLLLPKKTDSTGRGKLYQKWYQVEVRCPSEMPAETMVRSRCKIRIHAGKRSFAQWFVVQFLKTIRWHA